MNFSFAGSKHNKLTNLIDKSLFTLYSEKIQDHFLINLRNDASLLLLY